MNTRRPRNSGFTHVELVTVLSVMSLLSAVALPKMVEVGSEARRATMQALAATLTQASVLNGAQGQLRADAEPVLVCRHAGRLLVNATMQGERLLWQGRELVLDEGDSASMIASHRQCVLRDSQDSAAGSVTFVIRTCSDQLCRLT